MEVYDDMRYILKNLEIIDTQHALGKVPFIYGPRLDYWGDLLPADHHRHTYTRDDAKAVCDWLNLRVQGDGYRTNRKTYGWFDADMIHEDLKHSPFIAGRRVSEWPTLRSHRLDYTAIDWQHIGEELIHRE